MQEGTLNILGSVFQALNAHLSHMSNFTGSVKLSRCELADISAFSLIRTTPLYGGLLGRPNICLVIFCIFVLTK